MAVATFTKSGTKSTTAVKLNSQVFGVAPKTHDLLKDAYLSHTASSRRNLAVTKTRGLVSGGGKKPWRQKGTGRARFGSTRNPIWRGGGIAFGPTGQENFKRQLNTKQKRLAIKQALSLAASEDNIIVLEDYQADGTVKKTISLIKKISAEGSILLIVSQGNDMTKRSTSNIQTIKVAQARYLNVVDIMNADTLVITKDALNIIDDWLGEKNND